eukprot:1034262-Pyramimonas_sp.AAC.1
MVAANLLACCGASRSARAGAPANRLQNAVGALDLLGIGPPRRSDQENRRMQSSVAKTTFGHINELPP